MGNGGDEIETVLATIWDLHDKISDTIHSLFRSHFLRSIKTLSRNKNQPNNNIGSNNNDDDEKLGFVFVKDFGGEHAAMAEAKNLNAIRTALENLEDQLEFFHTLQSQQRADRDAALVRLEQSRIILAMRLADHQGKKYKVIEEALAFVGHVHDSCRFVELENVFEMPRSHTGETLEDHKGKTATSVLMRKLVSSFELAKKSLKMEKLGGVLGNTALFAVSILAFLQLHHIARKTPQLDNQSFNRKRMEKSYSGTDASSQVRQVRQFDVFSARG